MNLSAENLAAPDFSAAFAQSLVKVTSPGETSLDGFLILLHSASSPRAAVALVLLAGMHVMRQMLEIEALASAKPEDLEMILTPVVRTLFEQPTPIEPGND